MHRIRVLYVTERFDGPYRYRCQQACEQLRESGDVANVLHVEDPSLLRELPRYGAVVLFRLPWSERVEAISEAARRAGLPVFFDIDDLAFDPSFSELMPFRDRYGPEEWARAYGRSMALLRKTFDRADFFIGSTAELVDHARRFEKISYLHRNSVPDHYLRAGLWTEKVRSVLRKGPTIGYFSGSDTHDADFASIVAPLSRVLERQPEARLLVVGYLDLPGDLSIERRTVRLPYMHYRDFAIAYAACHVVIAPLAVENAFTDSKSALKFFEAGAFFTPTVATPVREMREAITDGESGFLATTEREWEERILTCLDSDAGKLVGRNARSSVEASHSARARRGALHRIFEPHAGNASGTDPDPSPLDPPDETGKRRTLGRALRPGRATRDIARIVRATRRAPGPEVDAGRLGRFLDALANDDGALPEAVSAGAVVVIGPPASGDVARSGILGPGELPGEERCGPDPSLTRGGLAIDPKTMRFLVFRLRAYTKTASARAQFFWQSENSPGFAESRSVSRPISTDGFDRTYVLDLHDDAHRRSWISGGLVTHLRIDPTDRSGTFRVESVVLLPEDAVTGGAPLPERRADGTPRTELTGGNVGGRLEAALHALRPGERTVFSLAGPAAELRKLVTERAARANVHVPSLFARGDTVTLVAERPGERERRPVDVVIPVWNARELVRVCVESVKKHAPADARIVVIDDASPDPEVLPMLQTLARGDDRVVLLSNPKNLGFVGTVNRGMRHAGARDVLLLNSDTEVFQGFLVGLRDAAYADPSTGVVSPLSNNATICSVPKFCEANALPEGLSRAEMAALVRSSSERRRPDLVTPHGFCMYVRSDCLGAVGLFDEERFGRGFGEENDFGERAKALGWKIVLADDVFVHHAGKASFSDEGKELERRHASVLERRHPGYHAAVATFVRENPLAPVHADLNRHLERRTQRLLPAPLVILHANPFSPERGGVEYCAMDLVRTLALPRTVVLYPAGDALEVAEVFAGDVERPAFYRFPLSAAPSRFCHDHAEAVRAFEEILGRFAISYAHVHHLMFLPLSFGAVLRRHGIPYVVTVHDFYPSCTSFNLLDLGDVSSCGPDSCHGGERARLCQRHLYGALREPIPVDPLGFLAEHQRIFTELLSGAERTLFPSQSTRDLTKRALPLLSGSVAVVPHGVSEVEPRVFRERSEGPLRVALVGQVAYPSKGAKDYLRTIELLRDVAITWHVFGSTDLFDFDAELARRCPSERIVRHGRYARNEIVQKLRGAEIDVALLLPPWPETFSYTLSEIEAAGLPVVARRIGALADRLGGAPHAVLVDGPPDAADALRRFAADPALAATLGGRAPRGVGLAPWAALHGALYDACAEKSPVREPRQGTPDDFRRLNELAVSAEKDEPRTEITRPAARHASAWWYGYAERAKPYVPESLRSVVRRRLSAQDSVPVLRFRLPGKRAKIVDGLSLDRRYLKTARLTVHGTDPQLLLEHSPLSPEKVRLVRFNLWCGASQPAHAQLYFRHSGDSHFSEEKSFRVRLDGSSGEWQEYVIRVEAHEKRALWYEGGPIVALRFDPIDVPGVIGLGELVLCGVPNARPA